MFCNNIQIGENMRSIRTGMGLSQAEVAELSGITVKAYSDFERGQSSVRLNNFVKICEALDTTPNNLLLSENSACAENSVSQNTASYRKLLMCIINLCSKALLKETDLGDFP